MFGMFTSSRTNDVQINWEELNYLRARDRLLSVLEEHGVDNWDGYEMARTMYERESLS